MKTRLTTLLASALFAAGTLVTGPATAQVIGTPTLGAPVGAPVAQTPFFQGVPANATIPRIVPEQSSPRPQQLDVNPSVREIRITFDQPMDTALFFWPIPTNDPLWPTVTAQPYWVNDRTVVLPVVLAAGRIYGIPINTPNLVFRGATGLYVNPGLYRFETRSTQQGGSVNIGRQPTVPVVARTPVPMPPPLAGGAAGNQGTSAAAPGVIGTTPNQGLGPNRAVPNQGATRQQFYNPSPNRPTGNPNATPAANPLQQQQQQRQQSNGRVL